jgi:hypothetical protein
MSASAAAAARRAVLRKLADVGARAEGIGPGPAEDEHPHATVAVEAWDDASQLVEHRQVHGVATGRLVDHQRGDSVVHRDVDALLGWHRVLHQARPPPQARPPRPGHRLLSLLQIIGERRGKPPRAGGG